MRPKQSSPPSSVPEHPGRLPATATEDSGSVRAVTRAFQVLRILALGGEHGMRLTEVVTYSGMSRPTVHRILQTLISEGMGEQDPDTRRYRLGPEISLLGMNRPAQFPVRAAADVHLAALANELGDTAFLTIRAGWDSVAIDRKTGSYPIKVLAIDVGARRPLGIGVAGVMLLASLPPEEAEHICEMNAGRLPPEGPSMATIQARVRAARRDGYAYSEVGILRGTRAIAIPVMDAHGQVAATLAITAMAERLAPDELPRVLSVMRQKAELITQRLSEFKNKRR